MSSLKMFFIGLLFISPTSFAQKQVETVPYVSLTSYLGNWHEIASIPQFFQRSCVKNTTANYFINNDGGLNVLNTCVNNVGKLVSAHGHAKVFDTQTNAKLSVTFLKFFDWIYITHGNYWVIDLADDYRYAVVGDKSRKYGWILSRTPRIEEKDLFKAIQSLRRNGYDVCRFNITPQDGGSQMKLNLCDIVPN